MQILGSHGQLLKGEFWTWRGVVDQPPAPMGFRTELRACLQSIRDPEVGREENAPRNPVGRATWGSKQELLFQKGLFTQSSHQLNTAPRDGGLNSILHCKETGESVSRSFFPLSGPQSPCEKRRRKKRRRKRRRLGFFFFGTGD